MPGAEGRLVVIAKEVGRLANRLLLFAHFIGAALEHGFSIANPAFGTYAHYFPATARDLLCRFPRARSLPAPPGGRQVVYRATLVLANLLHRRQAAGRDVGLIRLARDQSLDLNGDAFLAVLRRHRVVLVQDWFFRNAGNVARHREAIRAYLTPRPEVLARARVTVERARREGDLVVGVHVRHGDYRTFKGGRYFYTHAQYEGIMRRVEDAFPRRQVCFLVCSDAPVPEGAFAGHRVAPGPGHELEDLHAFAACDRLVGPPSTFTRWASFYGDVPLCTIEPAEQPLDAGSFGVDDGLGRRTSLDHQG